MCLVTGTLLIILVVVYCRFRSRAPSVGKLRVTFLHPDLGLGGAERLVVDAATGLVGTGAAVAMCTCFHDPGRCFSETTNGTFPVHVAGDLLPRSIRGKGHILLATLRMCHAALWLAARGPTTDVYVVDQVAAAMPVLRLLTGRPVLFYCHHPDQLCDPNRIAGRTVALPLRPLKAIYRTLFDAVEGWTMRAASRIVCNSAFTHLVTIKTFPFLAAVDMPVLTPPVDLDALDAAPEQTPAARELTSALQGKRVVLSLNRYERKKNIALAIKAFARLLTSTPDPALHLVVAGGYDPRLAENVEHHRELVAEAAALGVTERVTFLRSVSDAEKKVLLRAAAVMVYTPSGEHFGIVPLEAMAHRAAVVAVADGGPLESVTTTGEFGLLRAPTPESFAEALELLLGSGGEARREAITAAARRRVEEQYSLTTFTRKLEAECRRLVA